MAFHPRLLFPFPGRTPSWFVGHMARSLRDLPALLKDIDLVIEARDARLPLTSVNPVFDEALGKAWPGYGEYSGGNGKGKGKEKLVVYTKRDLAEARFEIPLQRAFLEHGQQKVLFADTRVDSDVRKVLRHAVDMAKENIETTPELKILVIGMPNVGKSSLLNALRRVGVHKGKAFRVGAEAGITRKLTGTVKIYEDPSIYVYDTPGVMLPYLGKGTVGAERGMKLALTSGIKESLFEEDVVVDYLLYRLNLQLEAKPYSHLPLPDDFEPTNDIHELLGTLADRLGALRKHGERDLDIARNYLLRAFREGKLGQWTLDDLERGEQPQSTERDGEILSVLQKTLPERASFDAAVSTTVRTFLLRQQQLKDERRSNALHEQSQTQVHKAARKLEVDERKEKLRAKGVDVDGAQRQSRGKDVFGGRKGKSSRYGSVASRRGLGAKQAPSRKVKSPYPKRS